MRPALRVLRHSCAVVFLVSCGGGGETTTSAEQAQPSVVATTGAASTSPTAVDAEDDATTSTSTEASTSSSPPAEETTTPPSSEPELDETCDFEPIPVGVAPPATIATEDLDGDGTLDGVGAYLDPALDRWVLLVDPGIGGRVSLIDDESSSFAPGTVYGSEDLDGDGVREIFAVFDAGARANIVSVAQFRDCTLRWVVLDSGVQASFVVSGGLRDVARATCIFPEGWIIQEYSIAVADDAEGAPASWETDVSTFELRGDTFHDNAVEAVEPPIYEGSTPPFDASFQCGALSS